MADKKELHALDELFRKTFEDLPDAASASGWDAPSPQVWEKVQVGIRSGPAPWTGALKIGGMFLIASIVALGVYLYTRPAPQADSPAQTPAVNNASANTPDPAPVTTTPGDVAATQDMERREAAPAPRPKRMPAPEHSLPQPERSNSLPTGDDAVDGTTGIRPDGRTPVSSKPLPGSSPNPVKNTTEKRKNESMLNGAWREPLDPLPANNERPKIPAVPETLKTGPASGKQ